MLEGEDNPFNCNGGSICRCMRGDGGEGKTAAVGLWTCCVPGLEVIVPLPDSGPEVDLSPEFVSPALPAINPCVCWGGCCWEVGCGLTLATKDEYI